MKAASRFLWCSLLSALLAFWLWDAAKVQAAVSAALSLCAGSVIPALFPFLVVSSLLLSLGMGQALSPLLAGWMEPLFRVGGQGSAAVLLGFLGGYPIGARTALELYTSGQLSQSEAERLLTFCNNASPAFLISALGLGVFHDLRTGMWLWLIHVCAALLTGLLFRRHGDWPLVPLRDSGTVPPQLGFSQAFTQAVTSGLSAILTICAFVTMFFVLARPLAALPAPLGPLLTGTLELFSLMPQLSADRAGFLLAATAAGWGGLSVHCQSAALLHGSGLSPVWCIRGKAVQAALSFLLALLVLHVVLT